MSPPRPRLQTVSYIKRGVTVRDNNKKRTKSLARDEPEIIDTTV